LQLGAKTECRQCPYLSLFDDALEPHKVMTSDMELVKGCQPTMNGLNRQSNKPWLSGLETENEAGPEKTSAEKRIRPFF